MLFPSGLESRVRSIQVHEQGVKEAEAGQRVAINLAGIKVEQVQRGDVLAPSGSMEPTVMLDARLELMRDAPKGISNRSRLRLYHGTAEIMCRVILLDRDELKPGENSLVQLRLEEPLACRKGDRFVIRFYSPMLTIGGGNVLEPNPPKRRRFRPEVLEELTVKEKGSIEELLEQLLQKGAIISEKKQLLKQMREPEEAALLPIIENLKAQGRIVEFLQGEESCYAHIKVLNAAGEQLCKLLDEFHQKNPLRTGVGKEEVKSKLFDDLRPRLYDGLLRYFEDLGLIKLTKQYLAAAAFEISYTENQQKIKQLLIERYRKGRFNPPKLSELQSEGPFDGAQMNMVFNALVETGSIVKLEEDIAFHQHAYEESERCLKDFIKEKGAIQLGEYRDLLGTSRKYAMALLDSFDQRKLTKRIEDKRILY